MKVKVLLCSGTLCVALGLGMIHFGLALAFLGVCLIIASYAEYESEDEEQGTEG